GMTLAEVEEILGGPGEERGPRFDTHVGTWNHPHDETWVTVWLDNANRVTLSAPIPPETFMQKLKRLLHLGRARHFVADSRGFQARRAMTKKRWIVLAGMLAACVCLTLAVLAMLPPRPGVTPSNIERIKDGMTLEEVEKVLGGPGKAPGVTWPN